MRAGVGSQIEAAAQGTTLGICCPEHYGAHARLHQCSCAHGAGLQAHHQSAAIQAPVTPQSAGLAEGHDLRVAEGIGPGFPSVAPPANAAACLIKNHCSYRNLPTGPRPCAMAERNMIRFPDEVWERILALRPRDRDASSPTAAVLRAGIEQDRARADDAPLGGGDALCVRFIKICPTCRQGRDYSFWYPCYGLFYTWTRPWICDSCSFYAQQAEFRRSEEAERLRLQGLLRSYDPIPREVIRQRLRGRLTARLPLKRRRAR